MGKRLFTAEERLIRDRESKRRSALKHPRSKEQKSTYWQIWYARNRAAQLAKASQWAKDNADRMNARRRKKYAATIEESRARQRKMYAQNPEPAKKSANDRRARKQGAGGSGITKAQWEALKAHYDHRCAYCFKLAPLTKDHIVALADGGTHDVSNIAPACLSCNTSKADHLLHWWLGIHDWSQLAA